MPSLGSIDFAVVSNTGVISTGEVVIDEIVTASSIYEINGEDLEIQKRKSSVNANRRRRAGSSSRSGMSIENSVNKIPFMAIDKDLSLIHI